jgi:hypothetical protein
MAANLAVVDDNSADLILAGASRLQKSTMLPSGGTTFGRVSLLALVSPQTNMIFSPINTHNNAWHSLLAAKEGSNADTVGHGNQGRHKRWDYY